MKNLLVLKKVWIVLLICTITITVYAQRPETTKGIKDIVKTHKNIALLPFTFAKKEYAKLPDGVTQEIVTKSEKEKGLSLQLYLHERLAKKNGKYPYQWKSIEDTNKSIDNKLTGSALAKAMGVDAIITSIIETPKIILPDDQGGEVMGKGNNVYGFSGSGTVVIMSIYTPNSEAPIWRWEIGLNGSFKNTKLMATTLAKNYLADKFPYKF